MKTALVIMAAGIGSRFGGGIKQLEPVGLNGEIVMDYSVHDAIQAGFEKIIFIIRREIEEDFRRVIGRRMEAICEKKQVEMCYAFQELADCPGDVPPGRSKPWGTGQAVLAAKKLIDGPFAIINADDYYGKTAFEALHRFLQRPLRDNEFGMAGFILKNTLSDFGGVTRGLCTVDGKGFLLDVKETPNIVRTSRGAEADGREVNAEGYVSMNMWGVTPAFLTMLEKGFVAFMDNTVPLNPLKAEYLLPVFIGELLRNGLVTVQVLETQDQWFGVTYKEDKPLVTASIRALIDRGVYQKDLYADL